MPMTNTVKDTEYINKLVEIKRYYRSEEKFKQLVDAADKALNEEDYSNTWASNREDLETYLKEYFQLDRKSNSYITFSNTTDITNMNSYNFTIEIGKSPIEPKYAIGTETERTI